jgi:hypothetical protein
MVSIVNPQYYGKIAGKQKRLQGIIEKEKSAVAGADKVPFDPGTVVFLKDKSVMFQTQPDRRFEHGFEQERYQCLFELAVRTVLEHVNAEYRLTGDLVVADISSQIRSQASVVGNDVGFVENNPLVFLIQDFFDFLVFNLF